MDKKLINLLRDYGYKVVFDDHTVLVMHDNGYGIPVARYRSVLDAAERLAPLINTDEYFKRLHRIVPV